MRHGIAGKKFQRNSKWRAQTIRDMAKAMLYHQRITTTQVRAKEARKLVDQLITLGKSGTLAARRRAFAILCDHQLVSDLFNKIALRFKQRKGGYTRIIPLERRRGDNARLVFLEFTEKEIIEKAKPKSKKASKAKEVDAAAEVHQDVAEVENEPMPKSAPAAKVSHKETVIQDKVKPGKRMMGGIQKMFRRKTAE